VDIGVHQDGLVHVSELSDRFVKDPLEAIALGQQVKAWVLEVDQDRRRIALSLRSDPSTPKRPPKKSGQPKQAEQKKTRSEASDQRSGSPERSGQKTYSGKPRKPDKKAHPKSGKATSENRPEPSKATGDFQTDLAALMEKFNRN